MIYYLMFWLVFTIASLSILVLSIFHKNTADRMLITDWEDVLVVFFLSLLPIVNIFPVYVFCNMNINLKKKLHE